MRIRSLEFEPVEFELEESFSFGDQKLERLEYVLIMIETEDGILGLGEATPYWDPNGETQGSALGALELMKPQIEGRDATQINTINDIWECNCRRAYSARAGVDMALYDVLGQAWGVPVYELLGGARGAVHRPVVVPLETDVDDVKRLLRTSENDPFKLKADSRIHRLDRIGRTIHAERDDPTVAIDVNQSWGTAPEANDNLSKLGFEPDWIEQPIAASDTHGLQRVEGTVMVDESLYTWNDYQEQKDRVEMFNLKLTKSGGLSKSSLWPARVRKTTTDTWLGP